MATGTLAITNTSFPDNSTADGTQVITNFNDVVNYVNNRNDGTNEWARCDVLATTTAAMTVSSNQATTLVQINNSATDGDPVLEWALSGVTIFSAGVDDGDADSFKFGLAAIGTTTWLKVASNGLAVQFPSGTALSPGVSFISDPNTGIDNTAGDVMGFVTNGALRVQLTALNFSIQTGTALNIADGTVGTPGLSLNSDQDSGMHAISANRFGLGVNGALSMDIGITQIIYSISGTAEYEMNATGFVPSTTNVNTCGAVGALWSDVRSTLINGADYGYANDWFMREYPATFKDIQTQEENWFKTNANKGIQVVNDRGEIVAVFGEDGTFYAKRIKTLDELDPVVKARNITSSEDKQYEIERRKEIRGKK